MVRQREKKREPSRPAVSVDSDSKRNGEAEGGGFAKRVDEMISPTTSAHIEPASNVQAGIDPKILHPSDLLPHLDASVNTELVLPDFICKDVQLPCDVASNEIELPSTSKTTVSGEAERKLREEVGGLMSLVRTFSSALNIFVDLDKMDVMLGRLGPSISTLYKECIQQECDKANELAVAKLIARQTGSRASIVASATVAESGQAADLTDIVSTEDSYPTEKSVPTSLNRIMKVYGDPSQSPLQTISSDEEIGIIPTTVNDDKGTSQHNLETYYGLFNSILPFQEKLQQAANPIPPDGMFVDTLEEDPDNPFITDWDSDSSERFTPPIFLLPRQRKTIHKRRDHSRRYSSHHPRQRFRDLPSSHKKSTDERTRLAPPGDGRHGRKRYADDLSSKESRGQGRKMSRTEPSMSDMSLRGSANSIKVAKSGENRKDNVNTMDEEPSRNDGIIPPETSNPVKHPVFKEISLDPLKVNNDLLINLHALLEQKLEWILKTNINLVSVSANELVPVIYVAIVQTKELHLLAHVIRDKRVSKCPLIPRFLKLLAVVKTLPIPTITSFLQFFIQSVIPKDNLREIENDELLVNIGSFMGALTCFLQDTTYGREMLFNFLLYRPPFVFSFAHGLLHSDVAVIGHIGDFSLFKTLFTRTKAILIAIFMNPRFGDAIYAQPVIEMIKLSANIEFPDMTFEEFLWSFVEHNVLVAKTDCELSKCTDILAMLVIQKGLSFFENEYTTQFYAWTNEWNKGNMSSKGFACFIKSFGIIAEALRRNDLPHSMKKQQVALLEVKNTVNASRSIHMNVNNSVLKLKNVKQVSKGGKWAYKKRNQPKDPQKKYDFPSSCS